MSADSPWRDALRRASLRDTGATATPAAASPAAAASAAARQAATPPTAGPLPSTLPPAAAPPALAEVSPRLAELVREREALERQIQSLGAAPAADARYAVTPLAQRRAEFARWSGARDQQRDADRPTAAPPAAVPAPRTARPADAGPALRTTPGEAVPAGQVPVDPATWMAQRDRHTPRVQPVPQPPAQGARALREPGRALRTLGAASPPREDQPVRSAPAPADALDRLQQRVRRRTEGLRNDRGDRAAQALQSLRKARNAIPAAWEERLRERVPGLGPADPYVRDSRRKLGVAVGTLQEIGDKSDRLRETAQAVRELQRADEAGDDARRDRALERLKARRAEEGRDE